MDKKTGGGAGKKKRGRPSRNKPIGRTSTNSYIQKEKLLTHSGEILSTLQAKFIDLYIELGSGRKAVIEAGYKCKNPDYQANALLRTPKVIDEISYRMEQHKKDSIAKTDEILEYFTNVMRGKEKDQFGLDAPLSERTKAAGELAKRLIDIPNRLEANINKTQQGNATVTISLDWSGMETEEADDKNEGEEGNE